MKTVIAILLGAALIAAQNPLVIDPAAQFHQPARLFTLSRMKAVNPTLLVNASATPMNSRQLHAKCNAFMQLRGPGKDLIFRG